MTPAVFKESRKRIGLTQKALAQELGFTIRHLQALEGGYTPIHRTHELALRWIAFKLANLELPNEYQDDAFEN